MKIEGEGVFVSRPGQIRLPRLTVDEEYEVLGVERDPEGDRAMPDLTAETFDASRLWVATRAQQAFTSHHDTDAETAKLLIGSTLLHGLTPSLTSPLETTD